MLQYPPILLAWIWLLLSTTRALPTPPVDGRYSNNPQFNDVFPAGFNGDPTTLIREPASSKSSHKTQPPPPIPSSIRPQSFTPSALVPQQLPPQPAPPIPSSTRPQSFTPSASVPQHLPPQPAPPTPWETVHPGLVTFNNPSGLTHGTQPGIISPTQEFRTGRYSKRLKE